MCPLGVEFFDELCKVTQGEVRLQVFLDFEEGSDNITMADGDQFPPFFFIVEDVNPGHGFQAAAETIPKFSGSFGDSFEYSHVAGEEDDDFVLFADVKGSQDDRF